MLQDIGIRQYNPAFGKYYPKKTDIVLYTDGKHYLMKKNDEIFFPTFADTLLSIYFDENGNMTEEVWKNEVRTQYPTLGIYRCVSIDKTAFYVVMDTSIYDMEKFEMIEAKKLRHFSPQHIYFGAVTSYQIMRFFENNKYCGRCGSIMEHSETERAMVCPNCHRSVYPQISPAVTVSIIHKDKLLLARNKNGAFHRYAQIAGYVEVGETFEDTVRREVMEEVGLRVKNVQFYKNQPWALTDAHMIGYICELDGDDAVTLQEEELMDARWFKANEIPADIKEISLTYEMIAKFRREHINECDGSDQSASFLDQFDR